MSPAPTVHLTGLSTVLPAHVLPQTEVVARARAVVAALSAV